MYKIAQAIVAVVAAWYIYTGNTYEDTFLKTAHIFWWMVWVLFGVGLVILIKDGKVNTSDLHAVGSIKRWMVRIIFGVPLFAIYGFTVIAFLAMVTGAYLVKSSGEVGMSFAQFDHDNLVIGLLLILAGGKIIE